MKYFYTTKCETQKKLTGDNGIVLKDTGKAFQKELSKLFT